MRRLPLLVAAVWLAAACGGAVSPPPSSTAAAPIVAASSAAASTDPSGSASGSPSAVGSPAAVASAAPVDCAMLVRTPAQPEGPFYTPGSPERSDLREAGMPGTTLIVSGHVLTAACEPVAGATIDVWQADSNGVYDNRGDTLRGHLFSAADGSYTFTTVVPGQYPGRTEHIHVKVTPPGGATLTSQLYFPGSNGNDGDGIFDPGGLLEISETAEGLAGRYVFVL